MTESPQWELSAAEFMVELRDVYQMHGTPPLLFALGYAADDIPAVVRGQLVAAAKTFVEEIRRAVDDQLVPARVLSPLTIAETPRLGDSV